MEIGNAQQLQKKMNRLCKKDLKKTEKSTKTQEKTSIAYEKTNHVKDDLRLKAMNVVYEIFYY